MTVEAFLTGMPVIRSTAPPHQNVGRLCMDSRKVEPGDTFVAIEGITVDGHLFIGDALENGAALVFCYKPLPDEIPHIQFGNVSPASLAARFYDYPASKLTMVGITGTNGKTTVSYLLYELLCRSGFKTGLIGTNEIKFGGVTLPSERTTPDALALQSLLSDMVSSGCSHCVMEVSSHALELGRVEQIRYKAACFTNLTQDHLDFHQTMEDYFQAKRKLFSQSGCAVVNLSDAYGSKLRDTLEIPCLTFSSSGKADLRSTDIVLMPDCVRFTAEYGEKKAPVVWRTPGSFSVENALAVLGCGLALGLSLDDSAHAIGTMPPVKGRMEPVPFSDSFTVLIDYAHTPDALENAINTAKGFTSGRLITVFGCGGNRDSGKRPKMGHIASAMSDITVVTSDNPRYEEPDAIIREILTGVKDCSLKVIPDRTEAILWALENAESGDVVLLCGKGHETYQEIAGVKHPLDEREIIEAYRRGNYA